MEKEENKEIGKKEKKKYFILTKNKEEGISSELKEFWRPKKISSE